MDPVAALRTFVRHVTRDTVYLRNYTAVVQRQHGDLTLDLLPDDERVRGTGLSNVPIRHGLPGVEVSVVVGSRVLLGFENGDPRQPYCSLWDPSAIEEIRFDGGTASVARVGDVVVCSWPASLDVTGTITAPAGAFKGILTIGTQSSGTIQTGASRVKA